MKNAPIKSETIKRVARSRRKPVGRQKVRRAGAVTIEMAVVAPFVFLLIFTCIEFSRMMMMRQALTNAAREGARKACLLTCRNETEAAQAVRDVLRPTMRNVDDPQILRVAMTPSFTSSPASGTRVTATVAVNCADVSWAPTQFFGGAAISATASMNRE